MLCESKGKKKKKLCARGLVNEEETQALVTPKSYIFENYITTF